MITSILIIHLILALYLWVDDFLTRMVNVIASYSLYFTLPIFLILYDIRFIYISWISLVLLFIFLLLVEVRSFREKVWITSTYEIFWWWVMDVPIYILIINILYAMFLFTDLKMLLTFSFIFFLMLIIVLVILILRWQRKVPFFTLYLIFLISSWSILYKFITL